ncbi:DUF4345 domain-containing protein [Mesobacterium pallidum]|uniref:DUF4345 domain-containing protein n=1 Tax=Mesobacterium pallidum TaxID=2872037 RepID=UPI001EE1D8E9|nr:DUF4345 domain-containing protein [Mesobacterium pallidum]
MTLTGFQKIALGLGGSAALSIGLFITLAPQAFYAGYGITLAPGASMLSELRAPGAALATLGALMLAGIVRARLAPIALAASLTVFLGFPAGRVVSLALDGLPSASVLAVLGAELAIALLLLAAFRPMSRRDGLADMPG